ncbi:hypothetical protein LUZ60_016353 [Juncus effusus]|nr:hypothetical protein LUZ60_016353 [Juncus effusus]
MPAVATAPKTSMAKLAKEKKTTKVAKPSAAARSHPPYFQMIKEAILALRERTGSSSVAIAKHMEENHKGELPANFKKMLLTQLRNSTAKGRLVKVKASFKLSEEAKKAAKPAKEKKTETEKVKKPTKKAVAGVKRKAPSATAAAKPKKKAEAKVKPAKKAAAVKKVKKVAKSPAKAKKPKSIKSPGAKKARVARA